MTTESAGEYLILKDSIQWTLTKRGFRESADVILHSAGVYEILAYVPDMILVWRYAGGHPWNTDSPAIYIRADLIGARVELAADHTHRKEHP